jgi:hypothetical protein
MALETRSHLRGVSKDALVAVTTGSILMAATPTLQVLHVVAIHSLVLRIRDTLAIIGLDFIDGPTVEAHTTIFIRGTKVFHTGWVATLWYFAWFWH